MAGNKPCLELKAFPCKLSVWENEHIGKNGKPFKTHSIKLVKCYQDSNGAWKDTPNLNTSDLLIAAALLTDAWRTIAVKDGSA